MVTRKRAEGTSFRCTACDGATAVLETRELLQQQGIRRRRECKACGHRFSTNELFSESKQ